MTTMLVIASVVLWLVVLLLGFLLLGALRSLAELGWQVQELEATTPNRAGRSGLKPGKRAPEFSLPGLTGTGLALGDFAGRKVFLVFTQAGCSPCQAIVPELNRLAKQMQVLAVCHGDAEAIREWVAAARPIFPVLVQERFGVSKQYEVFATPFAFLIDERGVIRSKGIVNKKEYIGFVLAGASEVEQNGQAEAEKVGAEAEVS
jgi:methylamine dehydrogenase accessory protein MauD